MMKIVDKWRRYKRRKERKYLRKVLHEGGNRPWIVLTFVVRVLEAFDFRRFERQYHQADGELIRVELSVGPMELLRLTEECGLAIQQSTLLLTPHVVTQRAASDLDTWLTVDDHYYLKIGTWLTQMIGHVGSLQGALKAAEVCADDKLSYYVRKTGPLIKDLSSLALALLDLEESYDSKAT